MAIEDYLEPGLSPWSLAAMNLPIVDDLDDAPSCWLCGDAGWVNRNGRMVECDHRDPRRHRTPEYMCAMQPTPPAPPVPAPDPWTVEVPPPPF